MRKRSVKNPKYDLTLEELKDLLKIQGVVLKKSYCHEDYLLTSISIQYDLKKKLDDLHKKLGITRSKFFQMIVRNIDEDKFKKLCLGE